MAKRRRHYRTSRSFDRRPGRRPPRKCVLIVCEGRKTEPAYFKGFCKKLRLHSAEVRICGEECGNAPVSVVEFARQETQQRKRDAKQGRALLPFESVWCVMDVEQHGKNPTLSDALQRARDGKLNTVLSNPCFEFWILLHFEDTAKPFTNCDEVITTLQKVMGRPYRKGGDIFDLLSPNIGEAIRRATSLERRQRYDDANPVPNPSTQAHHLTEFLCDMAAGSAGEHP